MKWKQTLFLKFLLLCSFISILLTVPAFTETTSPPTTPNKWSVQPGPASNLRMLTSTKQLFISDNVLSMAVSENGKIDIYSYVNGTQWEKSQTLEVPEVMFTTFQVKDLNNDQVPEIIAGTTEPGFIYIYQLDANKQWTPKNDSKYIWSSVAKITIAKLDATQTPSIVVQNKEGFLFLMKLSDTSLDLVWKSPAAWKPVEMFTPFDLDNDSCEELVAVYKNGGIAVLKTVKNAISPAWETFSWGKILTMNYNDWDNNNSSELIVTSTQKMMYLISYKNKTYQVVQVPQKSQFNYVVEKTFFTKVNNKRVLITSDNTGKTHLLEYSLKNKQWVETQTFQTGRILEIFQKTENEFLLVNQSLQPVILKYTN